jgi:hypothetical protein
MGLPNRWVKEDKLVCFINSLTMLSVEDSRALAYIHDTTYPYSTFRNRVEISQSERYTQENPSETNYPKDQRQSISEVFKVIRKDSE